MNLPCSLRTPSGESQVLKRSGVGERGVKALLDHVRGSYLPDLHGRQVQVAFGTIPTVIAQIMAGKLRALAAFRP